MRGYIPADMDEKWSVFFVDSSLLIQRTWASDTLAFGLRFESEGGGSRVAESWIDSDYLTQATDLGFYRELLRMIIDGLLQNPIEP